MALYYFHLRDGADRVLDPEGRQLDGPDAIARAALVEARGIMSVDIASGALAFDHAIEVEDAGGTVVHRLDFADAVTIRWPAAR